MHLCRREIVKTCVEDVVKQGLSGRIHLDGIRDEWITSTGSEATDELVLTGLIADVQIINKLMALVLDCGEGLCTQSRAPELAVSRLRLDDSIRESD